MTSVLIFLGGFDPGTYSIEDDGIGNNGIARLHEPDGSDISFGIPTEFLTVTASAGRSVVFNLTESFGAADINVGNLTNAAENPDSIRIKTIAGAGDVLLVSNGSITEFGADSGADVTAASLILGASTGVGTPSLALETQVGTLEARTTTGGINLTNFGNVIIGGLTDDVVGLDVETSGNITLTNFGSIVLSEESPSGFESVHGGSTSGNVTLTAKGFDADIFSNVDQDAIAAPGGNITLTAGRDVSMGTLGLSFDNDVRARGTLTINTGRDLNIDGFADLASDGFGAATGGGVIVNAGRDINLLNSTGTDGSLGAEGSGGGDVILNTGSGGFVRLLAGSAATLFSSSGDVRISADRMVISGTSGITASNGGVTIKPVTEGWNIDLGSATDGAFALALSDAELDRIFTPTLFIGGENTGVVTVSSSLSPLAASDLTIQGGSDVTVNGGVGITVSGNLNLQAADNISLIAGSTVAVGGIFSAFVDFGNADPGVGGTAFVDAGFTSAVRLFGNSDADTLFGGAGADILDGKGGADTFRGRLGDDIYKVDNFGDTVIEGVSEGTDTVQSSVSHTLAANVEKLVLTGSANTSGKGNALNNILTGNAGNNVLDGDLGADTMSGGAGDDTYTVDNVGDTVVETSSTGIDLVRSSVTFSLGGKKVENLTLLGSDNIDGIGNSFDNTIIGNSGGNALNGSTGNDTLLGGLANDTLIGGDGDDTLNGQGGLDTASYAGAVSAVTVAMVAGAQNTGGAGIDTLIGIENLTGSSFNDTLTGNAGTNILTGGNGADTMTGLGGNDTYIVDNVGDSVVEANVSGTDLVQSSVSFSLGSQFIEKLTLTGSSNINGTGNTLDNTLTGNSGNNVLNGGTGADTLLGEGGADTLIGGLGRDVMTGGAGADVFDFNAITETGTTGATRDVIIDFVQGSDKFDLSTIDANTVLAGNQAFTFIGAAAFSGVAGELRASGGSTTLVHGDVNGDMTIDFSITLTGVYALLASDFVL